jgi:peptidoglycan/LPS O-acetylase OafA/YrhL
VSLKDAPGRTEAFPKGGRLQELDGLRGFAILIVFLLHYISSSNAGAMGSAISRFAALFRLGWTGVDLFFVLSGFLIGGILLDARSSSSYFRTFYYRRAHRILPVYFGLVTIFGLTGYLGARIFHPQHPLWFATSIPLVVYYLFLQNMVFRSASHFAYYSVVVTWSLCVEEQFYLVSPFLIRYLPIRRLKLALLACVIGAPILRYFLFPRPQWGFAMAYTLTPCRADALALGMLSAIAWRGGGKDWLARHTWLLKGGLALLSCAAIAMEKWLPEPRTAFQAAYQYSLIALMYTCLMLLTLVQSDGVLARVTRMKFLRAWGRVSYCVYLIHFGILGMCHWLILRALPRINDWPGVLTTILAAGLTWMIAQLSWRFFENPLIAQGHAYAYGSRVAD